VEIVSRVELLLEPGRHSRIPYGQVEIDHAVIRLAGPDPLVERRTLGLAVARPVAGALEWRERRTEDLESAGVRTFDELPLSGDEIGAASRLAS
jgi:hypothetical protein